MKKIKTCVVLLILSTHSAHAQTFDEWFKQKKTQIRYLEAQIAACAVFQKDLTIGYDLARSGLLFIGDTSAAEFNLHRAYFNSLEIVNPAVSGSPRIAGILNDASAIVTNFKNIMQIKNLSSSDMEYLRLVYNNMVKECKQALKSLESVMTDIELTMTDAQRTGCVDAIYADMQDKYAFSQGFASTARLLAAARGAAAADIMESLINEGLK